MEEVPSKFLSLIDEGYSFEWGVNSTVEKTGIIRLFKHGSLLLPLRLDNMEVVEKSSLREITRRADPDKVINAYISVQFLKFVFENISREGFAVANWCGWDRREDITIRISVESFNTTFSVYRNYNNSRKVKYGEFLPDILGPVSRIIYEYAEMPFYDFLNMKLKKLLSD